MYVANIKHFHFDCEFVQQEYQANNLFFGIKSNIRIVM